MSYTTEAQIQLLNSLEGIVLGFCLMDTEYALCSMSWMFSVSYCVSHCAVNIWHHILCYLSNIHNYITFTESLERVKFEFVQYFHSQLFKCCTSVILNVNVR